MCPLALISHASYLVLVHRLTDLLRTSFPRSVALAQLCFTSFAVVSSREDLHLQDCVHAGRTHPPRPYGRGLRSLLVKRLPPQKRQPPDVRICWSRQRSDATLRGITGTTPACEGTAAAALARSISRMRTTGSSRVRWERVMDPIKNAGESSEPKFDKRRLWGDVAREKDMTTNGADQKYGPHTG
jgi:hypothetical protein